ncbi:LuxR C-terminal-related transcriptional regulator [Aquimarina sediminis]|uniref:LuxR C-terminal-related transcriptional regulator n=1 Tax=Aquimarina sediminis TaxID=2070536 RepID=UPI000CA04621|nr:LuxR C-terminal-related transcriptional regulator [Aquimarina sediminis]
MIELQQITQEYNEIINQQSFIASELDYTIFENQVPFLNQMASVKNSGLSVFDFYKKEHVFNSYNLGNLFGYDLDKISKIGTDYYNSRIHPKDFTHLMQNALTVLKYYSQLPKSNKKDYKFQSEYRILNAESKYVRVIEQQQVLELDKSGNLWLALSIMDISPHQEELDGIQSQLINIKTGEVKHIMQLNNDAIALSKRETQILGFVKEGLLSKEISNSLSISVHTVNTHRQNILRKLGANNSIEAIDYAARLGLV